MANLLYSDPKELTLLEFKKLTGWSYAKIALELGQDERTLYSKAKTDSKDSPHHTQWRRHLALIYKVSRQI